jgi:CYTH domain-containing protein
MMRAGADEARSPKYAQVERERRWLVDPALRPDLTDRPHVLIEDRYIRDTRLRLRRMRDSASGAVALKLTKKYEAAEPRARPIVTAYLTPGEYDALAALDAHPLTKRRYKVEASGVAFSVDRFAGALDGLELAEIEWPDDAGLRSLAAPIWAVSEVSDDPRFEGGTLACAGLPKDRAWRNS